MFGGCSFSSRRCIILIVRCIDRFGWKASYLGIWHDQSFLLSATLLVSQPWMIYFVFFSFLIHIILSVWALASLVSLICWGLFSFSFLSLSFVFSGCAALSISTLNLSVPCAYNTGAEDPNCRNHPRAQSMLFARENVAWLPPLSEMYSYFHELSILAYDICQYPP